MNAIYLDNAATTKLKKDVLNEMMPYLTDSFSNPAAAYSFSSDSRHALKNARINVAKLIGANDDEIFFTSGGSESDSWLVSMGAKLSKKNHIITSAIEHHAVLNTAKMLRKNGYDITYIKPKEDGSIAPEDVEAAITDETGLVSIMYANNETGVINDIKSIGTIAREKGILFHTDAVQAVGHIEIDVSDLPVDFLSMSAHKFGGPKGVGAAYIRRGLNLDPIIFGGNQERGIRGGTQNVPGIAGMSKTSEIMRNNLTKNADYVSSLKANFEELILKEIKNASIVGGAYRLPGITNIMFKGIEAQMMLMLLENEGVIASAGSACQSGSLEASHVLTSMGLNDEDARSCVRFSFSEDNTMDEVEHAVDIIAEVYNKLKI